MLLDCQSAVRNARLAAATLWGIEEEVTISDLTSIAEGRLRDWLGWVSSRNDARGEVWQVCIVLLSMCSRKKVSYVVSIHLLTCTNDSSDLLMSSLCIHVQG